jgi:phosphatidylserine/phosphatidylglycerophosphate/cardiolipin synthase-like enzyme
MATKFEAWDDNPLDMDEPRVDLGNLSLNALKALPFEELGQFKQAGRFPPGYSSESLTFYSPRDPGVHRVIVWTLLQVTHSVAINMYGFDDPHVGALLRSHASKKDVAVTMTLDSSQAGGQTEQDILRSFLCDMPGNSVAIGRSERGAISHDKLMVVDGLYLISGSTNWSLGGEEMQDNQLTLARNPLFASEARAVIDLDHDAMLKQMGQRDAESFLRPVPVATPAANGKNATAAGPHRSAAPASAAAPATAAGGVSGPAAPSPPKI